MERLYFLIAMYGGNVDEEPRVVRSLEPITVDTAGVRVLIMNHGKTERSAKMLSDHDIEQMLTALREGRPVFSHLRPTCHYTAVYRHKGGRPLEGQVVQNDQHFEVSNAITLYLVRPYRSRAEALAALPVAKVQVGKVRQPRKPRGVMEQHLAN